MKNQRGSSQALSFRVAGDVFETVYDIVDRSSFTVSELMRSFILSGIELLESNKPDAMPHELERVWRDMTSVAARRAAKEKKDAATGDSAELLARVAELEAQLAAKEKAKSKRKSQKATA